MKSCEAPTPCVRPATYQVYYPDGRVLMCEPHAFEVHIKNQDLPEQERLAVERFGGLA